MSGFNLRRTLVAASVTAVAVGGITIGTAGPAGAWITKSSQASAVCVDGKVVVNASIANGEKAPKKDQPLDWNDMLVTASTLGLSDGPKLATIDGETVTFAINTGETSVSDGTVVYELDWANPGRPGTDKRSASYKAVDCKPDQPDPSDEPSGSPSDDPTSDPSDSPSENPSDSPSDDPSDEPSDSPSDSPSPSSEPSDTPSPDSCVKLTGSVKTTTADGSVVNGNTKYETKQDVYVYGDQLPDDVDTLYVRVTDPSGSVVLSATKQVSVSGGSFGPFQLYPYSDTPNQGGEYKVWVSSSSDFEQDCTKFDNFKVKDEIPEPPAPKKRYQKKSGCDLSQYGDFEPGVIARIGYESWAWDPEKKKYVLSGEIEWGQWFQKQVWDEREQFKYGCVTPMPSIDIEKYSSYDGPEAGDFDDTAKGLDPTADTPVSFIVTNNGNEPLVNVAVSDETTAGVGTLTGVSCDFSKLGGPATGTTWSGPFLVDDAFPCTGTLPALGYDANHTDVATVTAEGKYSETSVSDNDPWNGSTPPKGEVAIPTFGTEDPCNGANVTDNVTWTTPLPENSETTQYSESADGTTRTATLVDANGTTWTDGTTEPKVYTLPEDSGVACTPDPVIDLDGNVDVDCRGDGSATMDNTGSTVAHGFEVIVNGEPTLYMVGAGKSRTEPVTGAKPGSWVKVTDGDGNVLARDRTPRSCGGTTTTTTTDNPQGGPGGGPEQNNAPWLWVILGSMVVAGFAGRRAGVQFARH